MQRNKRLDARRIPIGAQPLRNAMRLRFAVRCRTGKVIRARIRTGTDRVPVAVEIPIQIGANANAVRLSCLAPHAIAVESESVAVRIQNGHKIPVERMCQISDLWDGGVQELIDDVRTGRRRNPFACMNAGLDKDARPQCGRSDRDFNTTQRSSLETVTDDDRLNAVWMIGNQCVEPSVNCLQVKVVLPVQVTSWRRFRSNGIVLSIDGILEVVVLFWVFVV